MSVTCQIQSLSVFLRALYTVAIRSDGWATVVFTDASMLVYVEGTDGNMTATCTMLRSLFVDYAVQEIRFGIHIPTLIDALLMLGPASVAASTKITLACSYETAALRVKVRPADESRASDESGKTRDKGGYAGASHMSVEQGRGFDADLVRRNAPQHLLDLHFSKAPVVAQVVLHGDTVRELIADLAAAQCTEVTIRIDVKRGLLLRGQGGPYGEVDASVQADSEVLYSLSAGAPAAAATTRVHTHHLALACGVRVGAGTGAGGSGGSSSAGLGGGGGGGGLAAAAAVAGRMRGAGGGAGGRDGRLSNADYMLMGMAASSFSATCAGGGGGGGAASMGALSGGLERLTLRINAERQLNVLHTQRDHDQTVSASMVVMPLSTLYDLS